MVDIVSFLLGLGILAWPYLLGALIGVLVLVIGVKIETALKESRVKPMIVLDQKYRELERRVDELNARLNEIEFRIDELNGSESVPDSGL